MAPVMPVVRSGSAIAAGERVATGRGVSDLYTHMIP